MRPSTRIDPPHVFAQLVRRLAPGTTVRVLRVGTTLVVAPHAADSLAPELSSEGAPG
jgi:hypothetical protein